MTILLAAVLCMTTSVVIYIRLWNRLRAKARLFESKKRRATIALQSGDGELPTWFFDENKLELFLFAVQRLALRKGVPHRSVLVALADEGTFTLLIRYAEALELVDATFSEQQLAIAELIADRFEYTERMRAEAEIFYADVAKQPVTHTPGLG